VTRIKDILQEVQSYKFAKNNQKYITLDISYKNRFNKLTFLGTLQQISDDLHICVR